MYFDGAVPVVTRRQVDMRTGDDGDGDDHDAGCRGALHPREPTLALARGRLARHPRSSRRFHDVRRRLGSSTRSRKRETELLDPCAFLDDRVCLLVEIG
jgi:hypothetical protein